MSEGPVHRAGWAGGPAKPVLCCEILCRNIPHPQGQQLVLSATAQALGPDFGVF